MKTFPRAFRVSLQFVTDTGNRWTVNKEFNSERHLNNFVAYIMRTKGYYLDEIFDLEPTTYL